MTVRVDAHPPSPAVGKDIDEDVWVIEVEIPVSEIRRTRRKGDDLPVGRDGRIEALVVSGETGCGHADSPRPPTLSVMDIDVLDSRVVADHVAGGRERYWRPFADMAGSAPPASIWRPSKRRLTRRIRSSFRSRTNTSTALFVSRGVRLDARDAKAINRASGDRARPKQLDRLPWPRESGTLTRLVMPSSRSRAKTSQVGFVSWPTRLGAVGVKAT